MLEPELEQPDSGSDPGIDRLMRDHEAAVQGLRPLRGHGTANVFKTGRDIDYQRIALHQTGYGTAAVEIAKQRTGKGQEQTAALQHADHAAMLVGHGHARPVRMFDEQRQRLAAGH